MGTVWSSNLLVTVKMAAPKKPQRLVHLYRCYLPWQMFLPLMCPSATLRHPQAGKSSSCSGQERRRLHPLLRHQLFHHQAPGRQRSVRAAQHRSWMYVQIRRAGRRGHHRLCGGHTPAIFLIIDTSIIVSISLGIDIGIITHFTLHKSHCASAPLTSPPGLLLRLAQIQAPLPLERLPSTWLSTLARTTSPLAVHSPPVVPVIERHEDEEDEIWQVSPSTTLNMWLNRS